MERRRTARLSPYAPGRLYLRDNGQPCGLRVSKRQLPSVTPRIFGYRWSASRKNNSRWSARYSSRKMCREHRSAYAPNEAAANRVGLEARSNIAAVSQDARTQWGM